MNRQDLLKKITINSQKLVCQEHLEDITSIITQSNDSSRILQMICLECDKDLQELEYPSQFISELYTYLENLPLENEQKSTGQYKIQVQKTKQNILLILSQIEKFLICAQEQFYIIRKLIEKQRLSVQEIAALPIEHLPQVVENIVIELCESNQIDNICEILQKIKYLQSDPNSVFPLNQKNEKLSTLNQLTNIQNEDIQLELEQCIKLLNTAQSQLNNLDKTLPKYQKTTTKLSQSTLVFPSFKQKSEQKLEIENAPQSSLVYMSEQIQIEEILIFTDGACEGNPGPGGWGALIKTGNINKELSGYVQQTTNNRMEMESAIQALEWLQNQLILNSQNQDQSQVFSQKVIMTTDSQYLIQGITDYIQKWQHNGWKTSKSESVLNIDKWKELLNITRKFPNIQWEWVKGHSGHKENEIVDKLAVGAIKNRGQK